MKSFKFKKYEGGVNIYDGDYIVFPIAPCPPGWFGCNERGCDTKMFHYHQNGKRTITNLP